MVNPATTDAAAVPHGPGRVRQPPSTHGLPQHGQSLPPPPPQARLEPFWAFHNLLYGNYGSQQSQASTSSEEIVKGHHLRNKGIGGLYIALVALGLCAFIWLVTATTLSSQATAPEEGEEEPAAVLRLEDSSVPLPFIRLEEEPRIFEAAHTLSAKGARVTEAEETSGTTTEESTGVGTTREANIVGQDKPFGGRYNAEYYRKKLKAGQESPVAQERLGQICEQEAADAVPEASHSSRKTHWSADCNLRLNSQACWPPARST
ncbi:hypothetical protein MTO96_022198 [Rhipicephalus appendiculatus]